MGGSGGGDAGSIINGADGAERGKTDGGVGLRGGKVGGGAVGNGVAGQNRGERRSSPPTSEFLRSSILFSYLLVVLASGDAISGWDGGGSLWVGGSAEIPFHRPEQQYDQGGFLSRSSAHSGGSMAAPSMVAAPPACGGGLGLCW
jgi:hypothetical protein